MGGQNFTELPLGCRAASPASPGRFRGSSGATQPYSGIGELTPRQNCLSCFIAGLLREVAHAKPDPDFFQESGRGLTARKDPDEIVRKLLQLTLDFENDGVWLELHGNGVEYHVELSFAQAFLDALRISFFDAAKSLLAIGKRDLIPNLVRKSHGGFDGAVASSHHQDSLVDVMVRFDQAVHDLWQLLAFHTQLPRTTALTEGENYSVSAVLVLGGCDAKKCRPAPS